MVVVANFQRWLLRSGPLWPLAVCRIIWAIAILLATLHESGLSTLYSDAQYHVPLLPFAKPLAAPAYGLLMVVAAGGGTLALLGLFTRVGITLVLASLGYVFALDLLLFRNHLYLGLLLGVLLLFAPCSETWSISALLRRRSNALGSLACAQLIKAQILIVYGFSVLNKLREPFLDGYVLERELPRVLRNSALRALVCDAHGAYYPAVQRFLHSSPALAGCAAAVVAAEAFLVIGLPSPQLRRYATAVGVALHTTIFLTMGIYVFGLLMLSSYVLFFDFGPAPASPPKR